MEEKDSGFGNPYRPRPAKKVKRSKGTRMDNEGKGVHEIEYESTESELEKADVQEEEEDEPADPA